MKAFSELTSASQVNNADLLAISQTSGNSYASKKTTVKDVTDIANLNLAEEYDSSSSYAADDYCVYESVLYKCISSTTGSFDSTKWTQVVITDEMGSGGGGGGSTTVIEGTFIDTSNVVKSTTTFTSSMSYTATEDCYISFYLVASGSDGLIKIDTKKVGGFYTASTTGYSCGFYLKKGQIIAVTGAHSGYSSDYTVYGVQVGSENLPEYHAYSTTEKIVGEWINGSPIYEKTLALESAISLSASQSTWTTTSISSSDIDKLISVKALHNDGTIYSDVCGDPTGDSGTKLKLRSPSSATIWYLTLQYTKSS